jgi:hypothetical protein
MLHGGITAATRLPSGSRESRIGFASEMWSPKGRVRRTQAVTFAGGAGDEDRHVAVHIASSFNILRLSVPLDRSLGSR